MIDMVPGFGQRFPKLNDEDPYWRDELVIETCCATIGEAVAAEARGANRIELCTGLQAGGLTPPRDLVREVVSRLRIPVNVLIRPGAGPVPAAAPDASSPGYGFSAADFVYDEEDIRRMMADIEFCKEAGAAGVVVGALTPEGKIDEAATRRLVGAAAPLPVTFHRAFDVCAEEPLQALEKIIALGCARLLTSGMAPKAPQGCGLIAALVKAARDRIVIMPGSGVKPENLEYLAQITRAGEFHGTSIP